MAIYYVDDGGSSTSPYDTWAKAAIDLKTLLDAVTITNGDIVYIGHDTVDTHAYSAAFSIEGPNNDNPAYYVSATSGSDPVTYQKGTSAQVDTAQAGAYDINIQSNTVVCIGVRFKSGNYINLNGSSFRFQRYKDCVFMPAQGRWVNPGAVTNGGGDTYENCAIDCSQSVSSDSQSIIFAGAFSEFLGLDVVNASNRTGSMFNGPGGLLTVNGGEFTGLGSSASIAISGPLAISNVLMPATWTPTASATTISQSGASVLFTNCGPANSPTYLYYQSAFGSVASTTSIYRNSGATIEGVNVGWLVTTTTRPYEGIPLRSPWIYGTIASTGSKTFDVFITNDTADVTDAEAWLEVQYLGTASEAEWDYASDRRVITDSAVSQTDDTTSTWTGTGPSFTYKQKLSVTATVNETGLFRARVCVGKASIASSAYFYIDPMVTVT